MKKQPEQNAPREVFSWKVQLMKLPILLLIALARLLPDIFSARPALMDAYQTRWYPVIAKVGNSISEVFPFSLAEILLYLLVGAVLCFIVWQLWRVLRYPARLRRLAALALNLAAVAAAGYFVFIAAWGLNYHGATLAQRMELPAHPREAGQLVRLCEDLLADCAQYRANTAEEDGVFTYAFSTKKVLARTPICYAALAEEYPMFAARYGSPKQVAFSQGMSWCEITGIFVPFTMEPNVNTHVPELHLAATACHEVAHLYGVAREDEANFTAYLACMASGYDDFAYSGSMLALSHAMSQLAKIDTDAYARIRADYPRQMSNDLRADALYWKQYEGPVAEASTQMNNAYLKSNAQQDGVKSYGRMVDLLLAYFEKTRWNSGE